MDEIKRLRHEQNKFRMFRNIVDKYISDNEKWYYDVSKDDWIKVNDYYFKLLDNMVRLSLELGLDNSLSRANLYSYLLYRGYLSKSRKNEFNSKDRKFIRGLYFADIMDGVGVCLNYSDMLSDYMNFCGYDSAVLNAYIDDDVTVEYSPSIYDIDDEEDIDDNILDCFYGKLFGNHAFTLINDKNGLYIYDVTNLDIYRIINSYVCELINGSGMVKIKPYISYLFSYWQDEKNAISRLFEISDYGIPYDKDDFRNISDSNIELFNSSISLLDDFYDEIRPSILGITKETDRISGRGRILTK